jgi:vitamin B12 transporter
MLLRLTLSCFLLLNAFFAFSQENKIDPLEKITPNETELEEVVVVDSRFEIKRSQSGKNVIKISEKELRDFQGNSLSELLQTYGGINIIGSRSAAGQNLNFSIRGGRNRQVLILIDGVRVSDPSRIDNDFDLNYLKVLQVLYTVVLLLQVL